MFTATYWYILHCLVSCVMAAWASTDVWQLFQPKTWTDASVDGSHESAIFSTKSDIEQLAKNIVYKNTGSLLAPIVSLDSLKRCEMSVLALLCTWADQ